MSYTTLNLLHRNLTGCGILRLAQGEELSTVRKLTTKPSIEISQPDIDIDCDIDSDVSQSNTSTTSPATTWSHSLRRFCEHIQDFLWDLQYLFRKSPYDAIAEEKHKLFWDGVASPVLKLHWSDENKSDQSWITRQFLKKYPQLDSVNFQASAKCDFHWSHWCFNSFKSLPKDHVCDSHRSLVHLQSIAQELYLKDAKFYYAADDTSAEVEVEAGTFVDDDIEAINQMGSSVRMREFGVSPRLQTIRAIRHYFVAPINAIINFFRPTWLWYPVKYIADVLVWPASTPWTSDVLFFAGLWNIGRALFAPTLVQVLVSLASTIIQHIAALSLRDELCEQNTHYGRLTRAVVFGSMIAWYYRTNGIYGVSFLVGVGLAELSPCRDWYYGLWYYGL